MKLKNLLRIPTALAADALTLGNFGEGSYTGRVLREDKREQRDDKMLDTLDKLSRIAERLK